MGAITNDVDRQYKNGDTVMLPMDTAAGTIPKGALVMLDATGAAVNGADTASCVFAGVALEKKTFAGSADGDTEVKVARKGIWRFAFGAGNAAVTDIGTKVAITDNNTVDKLATPTNDIECGVIVEWESASVVWIDIEPFACIAPASYTA